MNGIRVSRGRAVAAACAVLAVALGGGVLLRKHPSQSAPAAKPARSTGEQTFDKWCSDCHSAPEGPGSLALERKYKGELPAVLEQRSDLHPDYVRLVVRQGMSFMPSFRKTEISDADLALLTAYLASSQAREEAAASKAGESKRK